MAVASKEAEALNVRTLWTYIVLIASIVGLTTGGYSFVRTEVKDLKVDMEKRMADHVDRPHPDAMTRAEFDSNMARLNERMARLEVKIDNMGLSLLKEIRARR